MKYFAVKSGPFQGVYPYETKEELQTLKETKGKGMLFGENYEAAEKYVGLVNTETMTEDNASDSNNQVNQDSQNNQDTKTDCGTKEISDQDVELNSYDNTSVSGNQDILDEVKFWTDIIKEYQNQGVRVVRLNMADQNSYFLILNPFSYLTGSISPRQFSVYHNLDTDISLSDFVENKHKPVCFCRTLLEAICSYCMNVMHCDTETTTIIIRQILQHIYPQPSDKGSSLNLMAFQKSNIEYTLHGFIRFTGYHQLKLKTAKNNNRFRIYDQNGDARLESVPVLKKIKKKSAEYVTIHCRHIVSVSPVMEFQDTEYMSDNFVSFFMSN